MSLAIPEPPDPRSPTSARLLMEAAALFSQQGYDAATTRELAARLGITKASLYHHIDSKEDLLHRIAVDSVTSLTEKVRRAWETAPAAERLDAMIRQHVESMIASRTVYRVGLVELNRLSADHHAEVSALRRAYADMFTSAIRHDQADGRIRTDLDATLLTSTLLGMLNWTVFWHSATHGPSPTELADLYQTIFRTGSAPAPGNSSQFGL